MNNVCRENVVKGICDAFKANKAWSIFSPFSENPYRRATLYVLSNKNGFYGFNSEPFSSDLGYYKIRGCEMREAFRRLLEEGYHIIKYKKYADSTTYSYCVAKRNIADEKRCGREVFSFEDYINLC